MSYQIWDVNKYTENTVQLVQCRQEYRFEQKLHLELLFLHWMKALECHHPDREGHDCKFAAGCCSAEWYNYQTGFHV
uniref:Uncharacterized protein n=1 Tax=Amphimedon queenslandica TaxID=400682 RepID=A0A1X7VL74_AMPQE